MKYYLKDLMTNLYVGSYTKSSYLLESFEAASTFETRNDAETSKRNLEDFCGLSLKVIEIDS